MSSIARISRSLCNKQFVRRTAGSVRKFGGSSAGDPTLRSAPGGYPEVKFKKDVNDYTARTNDDEAYFCGRKPGTPAEGWELMYALVMLGMGGAMIYMYNQEDTSLEVNS